MHRTDFAINYNALLFLTNKSDSFCMNLAMHITDKPIYEEAGLFEKLLGVDRDRIVKAWDRAARGFETLPPDTEILLPEDPQWPKAVKDAQILYLRGNKELLKEKGVCIVGTRNPSDRGKALTRSAVKALENDFVIISGLAMGIDGIAHIQTLSDEKKTIAVIGTPIGEYYPPQHRELQDAVARYGLLVSRFALGMQVQKYFFMMRNLLMSQIGSASLVIESSDGGGGVSQAMYTQRQDKPVVIFEETYENRTFLWPRKFNNPLIVKSEKTLCRDLKKALNCQGSAQAKPKEEIQPELF